MTGRGGKLYIIICHGQASHPRGRRYQYNNETETPDQAQLYLEESPISSISKHSQEYLALNPLLQGLQQLRLKAQRYPGSLVWAMEHQRNIYTV